MLGFRTLAHKLRHIGYLRLMLAVLAPAAFCTCSFLCADAASSQSDWAGLFLGLHLSYITALPRNEKRGAELQHKLMASSE